MTLEEHSTVVDLHVMRDAVQRGLIEAGQNDVSVHCFRELDSTSDWLKHRLKRKQVQNEIEGVDDDSREKVRHHHHDTFDKTSLGRIELCVTDWQTAGNGRRGNQWHSKPGNITFSLLEHIDEPISELLGLSLVTGVCVAETLSSLSVKPVSLKWPNDVLLNDAKLGGLLTEIQPAGPAGNPGRLQVITGIGINLLEDPMIRELGIGTTSLEQAGVDITSRDALTGKLAGAVIAGHEQFLEQGWSAFAERWSVFDRLRGKAVQVLREGRQDHAMATGVNNQGALLVTVGGRSEALYSGDVSIRFLP